MSRRGSGLSDGKLKGFKVHQVSARKASRKNRRIFSVINAHDGPTTMTLAIRLNWWNVALIQGERIKLKWHSECCFHLFTSAAYIWRSANSTAAAHLWWSNKNSGFLYLIAPLNILYHPCRALSPPPTTTTDPPPKVAKDRYQIFKLGDVYRDLSWQISQAILFRYSRPFCEASWVLNMPLWGALHGDSHSR